MSIINVKLNESVKLGNNTHCELMLVEGTPPYMRVDFVMCSDEGTHIYTPADCPTSEGLRKLADKIDDFTIKAKALGLP
jgi:hypothetical protein